MEPHTVKKRRVRESVEADDSPLADESLRLAIQLQQEELQWAGGQGGGELDDDLRFAMELSQQGGGDDDDDIM